MIIQSGRFLSRRTICASILLLGALAACSGGATSETTDDPSGEGSGGSGVVGGTGGSGTPGAGGSTTGAGGSTVAGAGGGTSGATCVQMSTTTLLDFDSYDGENLSFLVAGMAVGGVYMGPWELTDELDESNPDPSPTYALEMVTGFGDAGYGLNVSDQEAKVWGGGAGFWMSNCVDAATYSGIRLQVRGASPTAMVSIAVATRDTEAPSDTGSGACVASACENASTSFALDADPQAWKQIDLPWSAFAPGVGTGDVAAPLSGFGIVGFVFSANVNYDEVGPIPAPYDFTIDEIGFF